MKQEKTFILKKWRNAKNEPWRLSLKDVRSKETQFFHDIEAFMHFVNGEKASPQVITRVIALDPL